MCPGRGGVRFEERCWFAQDIDFWAEVLMLPGMRREKEKNILITFKGQKTATLEPLRRMGGISNV